VDSSGAAVPVDLTALGLGSAGATAAPPGGDQAFLAGPASSVPPGGANPIVGAGTASADPVGAGAGVLGTGGGQLGTGDDGTEVRPVKGLVPDGGTLGSPTTLSGVGLPALVGSSSVASPGFADTEPLPKPAGVPLPPGLVLCLSGAVTAAAWLVARRPRAEPRAATC
jgi:hypothetical protein